MTYWLQDSNHNYISFWNYKQLNGSDAVYWIIEVYSIAIDDISQNLAD